MRINFDSDFNFVSGHIDAQRAEPENCIFFPFKKLEKAASGQCFLHKESTQPPHPRPLWRQWIDEFVTLYDLLIRLRGTYI